MQVTREVVNGADHLITDYMYNDDNVGINLTLINGAKTNKVFNLSGVPIEYNTIAFNRAGDSVEIKAHLHYDENKKEIQTIADVKYPHETVTYTEIIKDEDFAHDIINVCLIERKNLNSMPCYKAAFDKILEQVKNVALEKDVFIRTDEWKYMCYVYSSNEELLGVAGRLIKNKNSEYVLGEYVGKKLSEFMGRQLIIDICVNEDMTLRLTGVDLDNAIDSSLAYALLKLDSAKIKRIDSDYVKTNLIIPDKFVLPPIYQTWDISDYFSEVLKNNSDKNINDFCKLNKPDTSVLININKYLIW